MKFLSRTASQKQVLIIWIFSGVVIVAAASFLIYQFGQIDKMNEAIMLEIQVLKNDQAATAKSLGETIALLDEKLSLTKEEQDKLQTSLSTEQNRIKQQAATLENISGKVGTLEKLTYTDDELLHKYSESPL